MIRATIPSNKTESDWIEMIHMVATGEWEGWLKSTYKTYVFYGEKADEEQKEYDIFVKIIQNDDNSVEIMDVCDFFKEKEYLYEFCGYSYKMNPIPKWQTCSFPDAVRIYNSHGWIRDTNGKEYNKTHCEMKDITEVIDWEKFYYEDWMCRV